METLKFKKGTILYRVEAKEKRKFDDPKFYSYFRHSGVCSPKTWTKRCTTYCRYIEAKTKVDLNLLHVPYKTILYAEDVAENDVILAEALVDLAEKVYKDDKRKVACVKESVKDLILLESRNPLACSDVLSDWTLATLICKGGFDGMVRFVEGEKTNCYDEVAICSPEDKVEILVDEMIKL